jgi:DNA-damage-inducible protein J
MSDKLVQARVIGEVKPEETAVLAEMSLTASDAVRILLAKLAREKMMPRELFVPDETTRAAIQEARTGQVETATLDEILCGGLNLPRRHPEKPTDRSFWSRRA